MKGFLIFILLWFFVGSVTDIIIKPSRRHFGRIILLGPFGLISSVKDYVSANNGLETTAVKINALM
jgi:hypothetical protein